MVPYPARLDVPHELVEHVAWLLYERRQTRNIRWRRLGCFQQALLALVYLRKNETFSQLGAGFGISQATAWRYVDEPLDVLADWAPGLHEALTGLGEGDHVIVDGTLIPIDRIRADEPYYSQKHKQHGMNVQAIARPDGTSLWFSCATPGRTHDLTAAARAHGIVQALNRLQLERQTTTPRIAVPALARQTLTEPGWYALAASIADAEAAGHDPATLLSDAVKRRELDTAEEAAGKTRLALRARQTNCASSPA